MSDSFFQWCSDLIFRARNPIPDPFIMTHDKYSRLLRDLCTSEWISLEKLDEFTFNMIYNHVGSGYVTSVFSYRVHFRQKKQYHQLARHTEAQAKVVIRNNLSSLFHTDGTLRYRDSHPQKAMLHACWEPQLLEFFGACGDLTLYHCLNALYYFGLADEKQTSAILSRMVIEGLQGLVEAEKIRQATRVSFRDELEDALFDEGF